MAGISECDSDDKGNTSTRNNAANGHLDEREQMKQVNGESKLEFC